MQYVESRITPYFQFDERVSMFGKNVSSSVTVKNDNGLEPSMRIAMMTDSWYPTRDGVVTSICIIKESLEARGHEVFIIAPEPEPEFRQEGIYYFPAVKFKSYEGSTHPTRSRS